MDTTAKKTYTIGTTEFVLREYGDLNGFEEELIDSLLTRKSDSNEIKISGYEIFPVILIPADASVDLKTFDWRHLKNNQVAEILVDFAIEKKTSQDSIRDYMMTLTKKKMQQLSNSKENMGEAGTII